MRRIEDAGFDQVGFEQCVQHDVPLDESNEHRLTHTVPHMQAADSSIVCLHSELIHEHGVPLDVVNEHLDSMIFARSLQGESVRFDQSARQCAALHGIGATVRRPDVRHLCRVSVRLACKT